MQTPPLIAAAAVNSLGGLRVLPSVTALARDEHVPGSRLLL